jgi:hypothetical protein
MGYDPSRSPSAVDNLALGIRGLAVEDDASLSDHNSPYRNGTHISPGVSSALPHIRTAPLQHRGPYTGFPPPEYAPYYPGSPTGLCPDVSQHLTMINSFQIHPCTHRLPSPQVLYRQICTLL